MNTSIRISERTSENHASPPFRLITETLPVPILLTRLSDNCIIFANAPAIALFNLSADALLKRKSTDFYPPHEHQPMLDTLVRHGRLDNYELEGRRDDGSPFWVELSAHPLKHEGEQCLLSVWYDVTERKQAEDEIRKAKEAVLSREKRVAGKYLIFELNGESYGINVLKVQTVMSMGSVDTVAQLPAYVAGVIPLRGRVVPVIDIRQKFGMTKSTPTERTCIIAVELRSENPESPKSSGSPVSSASIDNASLQAGNVCMGMIVDAVTGTMIVKGADVEDPPPRLAAGSDWAYIIGMTKLNDQVVLLVNVDHIINNSEIKEITV